jgi:hypothetical protein
MRRVGSSGKADTEMLAVAVEDLQNLPWSCMRRIGSSGRVNTCRAAAAIEDLQYLPWICRRRVGSSGKVDIGRTHNWTPPKHKILEFYTLKKK